MKTIFLQGQSSYIVSNLKFLLPVFIVTAVFLAVRLIAFITKSKVTSPSKRKTPLNNIAKARGLNNQEKELLNSIFEQNGAKSPELVIQSDRLLDKYFKKAYEAILGVSKNAEDRSGQLADLFTLRNHLDTMPDDPVTSTHQIVENTPVIIPANPKNYHTKKSLAQNSDYFTVSCPHNWGNLIRIASSTVSFSTQNSNGVSFSSKLIAISHTHSDIGITFPHMQRIKPLLQRKYRRKNYFMPCFFQQVSHRKSKRKKQTEWNRPRIRATLLNIGEGGCSIKSPIVTPLGTLLKIMFSYSDNTIACLGQVLQVNHSSMNITLHIKFIKVPRTTSNAINALVFDFDENAEEQR